MDPLLSHQIRMESFEKRGAKVADSCSSRNPLSRPGLRGTFRCLGEKVSPHWRILSKILVQLDKTVLQGYRKNRTNSHGGGWEIRQFRRK